MIPEIPKINTALSYTEYLQLKADSYNSTTGSLTGYDCPICKNKGYIEKIVDDSEVLVECKCLKIRDTLRRIKDSGLEELLRCCTFRNFETTEEWQKSIKSGAMRFAEQDKGFFYIGGQSGCGKTHLCTAIIGALIKKGKSARYFVWREDSTMLKAMVNDREYTECISGFKTTDVLYIDDLFKQSNVSDADVKLAFELIDYRARNSLTTVISSELNMDDLIDIDEALGGRIVKMTRGNRHIISKDRKKNYRLRKE
jgi:uncharacterized protein yqaM